MVKGYKVFDANWRCMGKQYACPAKFEEDVEPRVCLKGMHFCKVAVDCFHYYGFNSCNKVAEVIAYGDVDENGDKCCTNKLEIVREIPWTELLEIVNTGKCCTGICNSGDYNSGSCNSGWYNTGNYNSGNRNTGFCNSGLYNSGDFNSGDCNSGGCNSGTGNSGNNNNGNYNTGSYNRGDRNSGDFNKTSFSNGCFNTKKPKIYLFNKPSEWTYQDWLYSPACNLLQRIPNSLQWISDMADAEKEKHPEAEVTGGYLKKHNSKSNVAWWRRLTDYEKEIIKAIPNFDKAIFKEITGIDVDM